MFLEIFLYDIRNIRDYNNLQISRLTFPPYLLIPSDTVQTLPESEWSYATSAGQYD